MLWLTGDRCFDVDGADVDGPTEPPEVLPATGEFEYLRCMPDGDSGAVVTSADLMLTLMGRESALSADLCGILSGGPIGLSSRLRLRFLSGLLAAPAALVLLLRSSVRRW